MIRKLRLKFIVINMAFVLLVLLVMFALVFGITRRDLEQESVRMMKTVAEEPFRLGRPGELGDEVQLPYFVVERGLNGELLTIGGYFDLTDQEHVEKLYAAAEADGRQVGVLEEYGLRYCFARSRFGACVVFADMSSEKATLSNLIRACLIIGAVSLAAFFLISLFLARWAVRPVEQAWDQQRQFVADASHELKTPLTVILTNAELLKSPSSGERDREQYADNILAMSERMRGLVGSLLELARVENGAVKKNMEPLDLSALVNDAALPFEPMFFEKGLELEINAAPGLTVRGSAEHLRQAVEILLDNALKYSEAPGKVAVELKKQGRRALLSVASPGEAMTKTELADIFKRFYRTDRARAMDGSYGLGLPIASGIAEEHGGRIWAQSEGGYNTFFVELPSL